MRFMFVTLEVSKVSGWLNAFVSCRVQRETCEEGGRRAGGEGVEAAALQGETNGGGGMGRRGAHLKHVPHADDAGRVEAQRLVERSHALPSPKGGHK